MERTKNLSSIAFLPHAPSPPTPTPCFVLSSVHTVLVTVSTCSLSVPVQILSCGGGRESVRGGWVKRGGDWVEKEPPTALCPQSCGGRRPVRPRYISVAHPTMKVWCVCVTTKEMCITTATVQSYSVQTDSVTAIVHLQSAFPKVFQTQNIAKYSALKNCLFVCLNVCLSCRLRSLPPCAT